MITTNTTTTSAIPPPVMALDIRRTNRLLRPYLNGIAISVDHPQRIDDPSLHRRSSRYIRTEQADKDGSEDCLQEHWGRDLDCANKWPKHIGRYGEDL